MEKIEVIGGVRFQIREENGSKQLCFFDAKLNAKDALALGAFVANGMVEIEIQPPAPVVETEELDETKEPAKKPKKKK